jgi:hypothetical protein
VRDFSRALLKKASQSAGIEQDEKVRSVNGVGVYANYVSKSDPDCSNLNIQNLDEPYARSLTMSRSRYPCQRSLWQQREKAHGVEEEIRPGKFV